MLNIEKYKEEILERVYDDLFEILADIYEAHSGKKYKNPEIVYDWFMKKSQEPVLTDEEKEYLTNVIKPFRKTVVCIERRHTYYMGVEKQYIRVHFVQAYDEKTDWYIDLPWFEPNTMYTGMKLEYPYNLEELGL